ncbi:MAG TPA: calcium/sodium antiporter [Patescibacteria group bacterium]|nr:calcium/sodium antiporter [Patescibacteria group bacterium]
MLTYLLLFLGFALLVKGADILVDGSSSIAKKFGISDLVIGLTIVAMGTSAPELVVNIIASIKGNSDIAIGNVVGSNIANILLILGVASIIYPLSITKGTAYKEIPLNMLAVALLFVLANDFLIDGMNFSMITRSDGIAFFGFFLIFLYYTFGIAKVKGKEKDDIKKYHPLIAALLVVGGIVCLTIGGKLVVDAAVSIASRFGISQSLIGLTIVAIGTSLPELATSAVAAWKKSADIAVGNIVGSNIFNIFWILGLSSIIHPIPLNSINNFDILVCFLATVLLFIFMYTGKKNTLERWQGIIFIGIYTSYLSYLVIRG